MKLSNRTLEKLRIIINGDDTASYRKGYQLVSFSMNWDFKMYTDRDFLPDGSTQMIDFKKSMEPLN